MDKLQKYNLAEMIRNEIENEFSMIHFSGNLKDTIMIEETENGYDVVIPAQLYDLGYFAEHGIIVYDRAGSYASQVDKTGGFSGKHKNYVEECIQRAIDKWMAKNQIDGKVM